MTFFLKIIQNIKLTPLFTLHLINMFLCSKFILTCNKLAVVQKIREKISRIQTMVSGENETLTLCAIFLSWPKTIIFHLHLYLDVHGCIQCILYIYTPWTMKCPALKKYLRDSKKFKKNRTFVSRPFVFCSYCEEFKGWI